MQFKRLDFKEVQCRTCGAELILNERICILEIAKDVEKAEAENEEKFQKRKSVIQEARLTGDFSELSTAEIERLTADIVLTTALEIPNRKIDCVIEVISAECVYGMHIFKDFFAGVRDVFGGRSKAIQDTLRDARKTALAELRRETLMIGGDAVIGVDLDYHEITGGAKGGMIMLVASGTAVKLK